MPSQSVGGVGVVRVLDHLSPEHPQSAVGQLAAHRPEPSGAKVRAAVSGLECIRRVGSALMEQLEAAALLHECSIVDESGRAQRVDGSGVIDERVLEQPQVPVATERIDVLVVPPEHGAEPRGEEPVEGGGRHVVGASDIGAQISAIGDSSTRRPGGWSDRRGRWFVGRQVDGFGARRDGRVIRIDLESVRVETVGAGRGRGDGARGNGIDRAGGAGHADRIARRRLDPRRRRSRRLVSCGLADLQLPG